MRVNEFESNRANIRVLVDHQKISDADLSIEKHVDEMGESRLRNRPGSIQGTM